MPSIYIGCAGWSIPKFIQPQLDSTGTHLARYATRFNAVEINSSFYRSHQAKTYQRWADSTPEPFRFAVKIPKQITHEARLENCGEQLERFTDEVHHLGDKLGPLLVQLPPSLDFKSAIAEKFFTDLRHCTTAPIVCEPRHASWFSPLSDELLKTFRIARVAADPAPVPSAAIPGGSSELIYFRLHGSPRMYYSSYDEQRLLHYTQQLLTSIETSALTWCIFDNTASGAAFENAMDLAQRIEAIDASSSVAEDVAKGVQQLQRPKKRASQ